MEILKLAAFSLNNQGGNPAGVALCHTMPADTEMLAIAREVGYSETAFLTPVPGGWRTRYFAPEIEVLFCGHATIASGAVLGERFGEGDYRLVINDGEITVRAARNESGGFTAALVSPGTWSKEAPPTFVEQVLGEFNWTFADLDSRFPVRFAFAGARHLILFLNERRKLAEMAYPFERVRVLMKQEDLVTIDLLWNESDRVFHARNPFPPGGVYEDPATGAAAAALAGYLRDIGWQGEKCFEILQGQDMGMPSRIVVEYGPTKGEGIKVSGETRYITEKAA